VLENNPFNDSLNPEPYKAKMEEIRSYILENLPPELKEAKVNALNELEDGDEDEVKNIENAAIKAAIAEFETMPENDEKRPTLIAKSQALRFLSSAIAFINLFESANPSFQGMLLSSNNSDVTEALRFFVRARNFQLPSAFSGIKTSLSLMWSDDKGIQDEVLNAFAEVFIVVPGTERKEMLPSKQIVDNLIRLVHNATVSELACIEEAISRLVKDELIPAEVFLILWSIAAKAPEKPRSAAMMLLSMGASTDPGIVDSPSRLRHLLEAGFGDFTEQRRDWDTARSAACALQRISRVKPDPSSSKFIVLEQIVERLCSIIQGDWCDDLNIEDTKAWFGAAEQAINAIFVVCPAPEQVSRIIILAMEGPLFGHSYGKAMTSCHSLRLARFLFVLGHIVIKVLVYVESLTGALRNANAARTLSKQEEADKARSSSSENDGDAIEAELGVSQAAEAETEQKMAEIVEKEIIGRGLIGLFAPLLIRIVANENGQYSSDILIQSATLSLCKFMCVSSSFCEKHLPLLFTKLANAPTKDTTLRANTVIALGDLAFRFPNEFEPYTPRLYACLRDKSTKVRRHTLMVLTHLILNDMVKVKGQVCEIALCLRDDEVRIRDMARLLFHELSKRSNNPIYNLLPDIVSQLSNMTVNKDDFRNIMSFLLGFIQKERQNEMLVDKLCLRFPKCTTISQKANISFCLAQLKINDRSMKLLNDHFKLYQDALFDDDVMKSFMLLVTKTKKFAKPELKQQIDEWESKLVEHSAMGLENKLAGDKAKQAKQKLNQRQPKKASRATRGKVSSISMDETMDLDKENIEILN
jgi:condensin complex subunit 1